MYGQDRIGLGKCWESPTVSGMGVWETCAGDRMGDGRSVETDGGVQSKEIILKRDE